MSDINLDFTVSNNSIDFTVQPNDITITPTDIQLTFSTNSLPLAGGSNTQLQYNNSDLLGGIPTATYDGTNLSLGNVANLKILGGTNGYVLQTDGSGNLDWTAMSGGGGNGTPGGSNTQIQYNDAGAFGGNTGFTFNEITGNVAIPGNLSVVGNIAGNVQTAYLANYATVANAIAGANVSGTVANANYSAYAGQANTSNLSTFATTANAVAGANVSGQVANALVAGTVYTNAQPNITSTGTLTVLSVTGNITAGNANLGNLVVANFFSGNGSLLTGINGANVSNIANANYSAYAGNVTIGTQSNITSVGNLIDLRISNAQIHLGSNAGLTTQGTFGIAIGANAGLTTQSGNGIAIGANSGRTTQGLGSVAIGQRAGEASQGFSAISIGAISGIISQGNYAIAIGSSAGQQSQGIAAIAIGTSTGTLQGPYSVALGHDAAASQGNQAVAIGPYTARLNQGAYAIAIGSNAAGSTASPQHTNSIILNATGANFTSTQANSLFVKPIRDVTGNVDFTVTLKYNPTTGEIGYV